MIWSNDLATKHDRSVVTQGLHIILKLADTPTMKSLGLRQQKHVVPQCAKHAIGSDDYWDCAIRYDTRPENHQTGSCRMGLSSDPMAVVDPRLKVHGVKGLRIADASVMPTVSSTN